MQKRIQWAREENKAAIEKLLVLLKDIDLTAQWSLWEEITEHMANVESHLCNALRKMANK